MKPTLASPRVQPSRRHENGDSTSLFGAATEVFSAGQQLLLDRVDLLQAEVTSDVRRLGAVAALFMGASAIALLGWAILAVGLAALLTRWVPLDASLGVSGLLNVVLVAVLGGLGYRRLSQPTAFERPVRATEESHA